MKFLMLESFFFITLGISCILLLMLIYHFKGRLSQLENNQQTLFEVVNTIVQELTEIKRIVAGNLAPMSSSGGNEKINEKINVNFNDDDDIPELIINEDEYKDDNEDEDDEETDDDDSDDEDETEEDDEDEGDTEDEEDNSDQLVVEVDNVEEDVKVVSVDIDESLDEITDDILYFSLKIAQPQKFKTPIQQFLHCQCT